MSVLTGDAVWAGIRATAKGRKKTEKVAIAVGYVTHTDWLTARRGDVIVVDGSVAAVTHGHTDPSAVATWITQGAEVRSVAGLHAKMYVIGNTVFIGSANSSVSSGANGLTPALVEGTVRLQGANHAKAARAAIDEIVNSDAAGAPYLDKTWVKQVSGLYRPHAYQNGQGPRRPVAPTELLPPPPFSVWLCPIEYEAWPTTADAIYKKNRASARRAAGPASAFTLTTFLTQDRGARDGDVILFVETDKQSNHTVWPPQTCVRSVLFTPRGRSKDNQLMFLRTDETLASMTWKDFIQATGRRAFPKDMVKLRPETAMRAVKLWAPNIAWS